MSSQKESVRSESQHFHTTNANLFHFPAKNLFLFQSPFTNREGMNERFPLYAMNAILLVIELNQWMM